jgi:hypothetical protein
MLPAAVRSASASTTLSFSELNTVLVVLLCTLRGRRHQRPRNTRYRAGATPYPNRTFTGWIAPASPGAREQTLNPFEYLKDVLERVVSGDVKAHQLDCLLPWNWKAERTGRTTAQAA